MKNKILILTFLISILSLNTYLLFGAPKDETLKRPTQNSSDSKSTQAASGSPTRAIQDLETKSESYHTGSSLTPQQQAENTQLKRQIITGTFDIRELCRIALDKHWNTIGAAEQNHFVDLMTRLLEKKAILSKEQSKTQGKNYNIRYLGDTYLDTEKTRAKTKTQIYVPKENARVSIDYKLVKNGNDWKIFDIILDDASLVDNYKFQFNSIISKKGYSELVNRINQKMNDLGSKS